MNLTLKFAFSVLGRNKMRSCLTMLGVIIGVGALVAMISVGQGASLSIQQEISKMGTNLITVFPGATTAGGVRTGAGMAFTLTVEDARAIKEEVPGVADISYDRRTVAQVVYGNLNWNTAVYGTTPEFPVVRDWPLSGGVFFTWQEFQGSANVAVAGQTVVDNLLGGEDPIGQTIRIKKVPFRIIGVLGPKGFSTHGQDLDDAVYIPFTTAEKKVIGAPLMGRVGIIQVSAIGPEAIPVVKEEIRDLLRKRHRLQPFQEDDFTIRDTKEIAATAEAVSGVMTWLLASIASISLLVGGIGIMNIMLVSVAERTREIGIRMAVGARGKDILMQFLTEALVLSSIGGLIGVVLGIMGSNILSYIARWPTLISPWAIVVAFGFSLVVGVFFGFYPARQASRMDPVECLRYE